MSTERRILVCQGRCCRKDGSKQLLTAFESQTPPDVQITPCGCLGQCGNGPNIVILPDKKIYQRVSEKDVSVLFLTNKN
ncbi:(2Fe-2S) ferredoxin domain-containing protein [Cyanothece sp. BG0011]|uniref:(2Fe-2S) ferredoxin domain-containing protein n=1 Tax=Cyanothece sp. BG0011 TaxID=2082950 RepID=UPI000D1E56FA|nr:(2Fe-2S) ferredoxin domain-containing protein [Cyanothece sp. BG0011]